MTESIYLTLINDFNHHNHLKALLVQSNNDLKVFTQLLDDYFTIENIDELNSIEAMLLRQAIADLDIEELGRLVFNFFNND